MVRIAYNDIFIKLDTPRYLKRRVEKKKTPINNGNGNNNY